ncbi:MAG TPA: glycosyltransferase family 2 protein [Actinomycetota bacterium]|nr:glycosyltransferase family 2 protein [Actinomycetota bacterium]
MADEPPRKAAPGRLSVVVPVYNEERMIPASLEKLFAAIHGSCWSHAAEVVVVDDGSTDGTPDVLEKTAAKYPLRVVRQENAGRFAARRLGIQSVSGDFVLLVDARVHLGDSSLQFLCEQIRDHPDALVWNSDAITVVEGNPIARFWRAITRVAWRRYYDAPRTTSYGLEEFDFYPKGTTCFMAPKSLLLEAYDAYETRYLDLRDANDDTPLIRHIAGKTRIHISPLFSCLYHSRDSLGKFLRHSYHRGLVFVDGYLHPGTRWFAPLVGFYFMTPAGIALLFRWPPLAALMLLIGLLGLMSVSIALGAQPKDAVVLTALSPLFTVFYGAGVWAGLIKAGFGLLRRRSS